MQVLVVGAGAMGRWFGRCLRAHDSSFDIRVFDADPAAAQAAAEALSASVDDGGPVDLVCVAVPIPVTGDAIAAHADRARAAVIDLAGVMADPLDAMADAAPALERASFHPLFAPANVPGTVAACVAQSGPTIDRVRAAMADRGNQIFETDAATHDDAMATVQASAHAAVLAFGLAAEAVDSRFHTPVSRHLFDALAAVTGGDARVYADIQATFPGADRVADAAARIADADREAFDECYREASEPVDR